MRNCKSNMLQYLKNVLNEDVAQVVNSFIPTEDIWSCCVCNVDNLGVAANFVTLSSCLRVCVDCEKHWDVNKFLQRNVSLHLPCVCGRCVIKRQKRGRCVDKRAKQLHKSSRLIV